jgi:hypothetical protein
MKYEAERPQRGFGCQLEKLWVGTALGAGGAASSVLSLGLDDGTASPAASLLAFEAAPLGAYVTVITNTSTKSAHFVAVIEWSNAHRLLSHVSNRISQASNSCNFFGPVSVFIIECKGKEKMKRENLFQLIFDALNRWPELERRIFFQAHYNGQSVKAIARSLQLDAEEVSAILRRCDRRLYASLNSFRKSDCERPPIVMAETTCPAACGQDLNRTHALAFKLKSIHDISQTAV